VVYIQYQGIQNIFNNILRFSRKNTKYITKITSKGKKKCEKATAKK